MAASESTTDEESPFSIELAFLAECCSKCGEPREPGLCPKCNIEVGASEEVAEIAKARRQALEPADRRLRQLIERFGNLPEGNIVVSNDQFATAVSDAEIFVQIAAMTGIGYELEAVDVNDRATVGGTLRKKMADRVARVEALLDACEDLALFDPHGPAKKLRAVAAVSGRYGAELTRSFVAMLVAETIPAVRVAEAEAQRLIDNVPYADRIEGLAEEMQAWIVPDIDARAALVLDRPGPYSDENGFLDVGAVFGAFANEEKPFEELARCARRYFSHLIGAGPVREVAIESFLVLPAIGLATLDRPLAAHRIARSTYELLEAASEAEPEQVQQLVDRTVAEGQLVFEALEQIRRGFQLLAAGQAAGVADDGAILKTVMEAYKELAETSFRTYGWLVVDLDRIKRGVAPSQGSDPPMIGSLSQQLEASKELAASRLAACSDNALRNACGHSEYRWDVATEEVHDMRTDQRWSVAELEASVAAMGGAVAGADAGYSCFLAAGLAEIRTPRWAQNGGGAAMASVVAAANFSAYGFHMVEVQDQGLTVIIEDGSEIDKMSLMSTLGGMTLFAGPEDAVRVLGTSGNVLLEVEAEAFREASAAPPRFKDLAILAPYLSNAMRTEDPAKAPMEWVTVAANQVLTTALSESGLTVASMLRIADRFGYVVDFARTHSPESDEKLERLVKRLSRCRSFAFGAARGDEEAAQRFGAEIDALNEWIKVEGIVWPPQ
jgi:hypothetical protein